MIQFKIISHHVLDGNVYITLCDSEKPGWEKIVYFNADDIDQYVKDVKGGTVTQDAIDTRPPWHRPKAGLLLTEDDTKPEKDVEVDIEIDVPAKSFGELLKESIAKDDVKDIDLHTRLVDDSISHEVPVAVIPRKK